MFKLRKQSLALIGTFLAVLQPAFTANSQESNSEFSKLQSLLEAKKWYEADQETVSLIPNNWANLSGRNLRAIDGMWMQSSNGKYGLISNPVASELFLSVFSPSAFSAPSAVKSFRCNRKRYDSVPHKF